MKPYAVTLGADGTARISCTGIVTAGPSVPCAFSVKPVKTYGAATSIVSFDPAPAVSKPPIKPGRLNKPPNEPTG